MAFYRISKSTEAGPVRVCEMLADTPEEAIEVATTSFPALFTRVNGHLVDRLVADEIPDPGPSGDSPFSDDTESFEDSE